MAQLRIVKAPHPQQLGRAFPLVGGEATIGRDSANTIALNDPDCSRTHARIVTTGTSHLLVDMDSTNGTEVNGVRIAEAILRRGDKVLLGSTVLAYEPV